MRFFWFVIAIFLVAQPQLATAEMASATDKIVESFMELDFDESESVSYDEYELMVIQRLADRFIEMDTNEDEQISAEEYRAFWTEQKSQYYRPRR